MPEGHPQRVGRYRLVAPLGVGGMATVYLARQEGLGGFEREVALKLLHPHLATQSGARADFLEEARLAASIRHPHVVAVLDVGEQPPHVYLVMEYIEGGSLAALSDAGPPPRPVALRILLDALAGLHAAHELGDGDGAAQGVVHRDFSPQNILVGVDGVTRLTDFGIAKAKSRAGYTAPGLVKGKLRYMSPEQAQGKALDRRSDVWSAGAVAWELMTGARLFDDSDEVKTVLRLVSSDPPRLSTTEAAVPEAMSEAIACALRRSLAARTASAAALAERIRAAFPEPGAVAAADAVAVWARARAELLALPRSPVPPEAASAGEQVAPAARAEPVTATSSSADVRPAATGARRRTWALALAAVAAVAAVAIFIPRTSGDDPSSGVEPPSGNEATAAGTAAAPAATVAVPAAASGEDAVVGAPAFLEVRASTDLTEVRIGRRVVAIAPPASLLTLQLLREERGVALTIEARAVDGRRTTQQLAAGAGALTLELGAAADPASAAGKAVPARPRPGKAPPGKPAPRPPPLPASPYGSGGK